MRPRLAIAALGAAALVAGGCGSEPEPNARETAIEVVHKYFEEPAAAWDMLDPVDQAHVSRARFTRCGEVGEVQRGGVERIASISVARVDVPTRQTRGFAPLATVYVGLRIDVVERGESEPEEVGPATWALRKTSHGWRWLLPRGWIHTCFGHED